MSCACELKKMGSDLDRVRKLAKALAIMEQTTVVVFRNADGTFGFCPMAESITKEVVEYISEY